MIAVARHKIAPNRAQCNVSHTDISGDPSYALTDESSCGSHTTWRDRDHSRGSNNASAGAGGNIHASQYQSIRLQRDRSERDLALL